MAPADVAIVAGNRAESSSAKATLAISSPAAIRGSTAAHSAASPAAASTLGTSTAVDRNGLTSSTRPISSIAMPISTGPAPAPPYSSAISNPVSPMAARSCHTFGSRPVSLAISVRTCASLECRVIKSATALRSARCSSLTANGALVRIAAGQPVGARALRRLAHWLAKNDRDTAAFGTTWSKPWKAPGTTSTWHGTPAAVRRSA